MPEDGVDAAALATERRERRDQIAAEVGDAGSATAVADPDTVSDPATSGLRGVGVAGAPAGSARALLVSRTVAMTDVVIVEGPDRGGVERVGGQAVLRMEDPGNLTGTVVGQMSVDTRQAVQVDRSAQETPGTPTPAVDAGASQRVSTSVSDDVGQAGGTRRERASADPRTRESFGSDVQRARDRIAARQRQAAEESVPDPGGGAPSTPSAPAAPEAGGGIEF